MKIDAHHHLWILSRGDYGWLTPELAPIYRDFRLSDLAPHLAAAVIEGTILVQAAPTEAETMFLLDVADNTELVRGVVGWTDFNATDGAARIDALAARNLLVGLRPMVQDIADDDWLLGPALTPLLAAMARNWPGIRCAGATAPFAETPGSDRQTSRSDICARPLRQTAARDRRDCDLATRCRIARRTPEHRLQTVGTGYRGCAGLADCGSAPGGGSRPCVLRATTSAVGKRLASRQSGGRICQMVRCRRNLAGRSVT